MPRIAEEPLRKVTINLFDSDVAWLQANYDEYSEQLRKIVRRWINARKGEKDE